MDRKENNECKADIEIEEKICELTRDTEVPASLEPEAVEKLLEQEKRERVRRYRWKYAGIGAACLCLAVGVGAVLWHGGTGSRAGEDYVTDSSEAVAGGQDESGSGKSAVIASAEDYDQIYEYIQREQQETEKQTRQYGGGTVEESAADAAQGAENSGAYSDTNVRSEGVGEADIVKTDGENLYILNGQKVEIVGIASVHMEERSEIRVEDNCYVGEIYADGGYLAVMYTRTEYNDEESGYYREYTCTDVYDVSDPYAPEKVGTVSQSGAYNTMRARGGYLYVLSNFYADSAAPRSNVGAYIPEVQGSSMSAEDIYMPQMLMGSQYTVISAFLLADPTEKTDSKAVFGAAGMCYVSAENIYITESHYGERDVSQTSIRKVSCHDGTLEGVAQTKVAGTLNDSFSIDEYNGYLRLVTTVTPSGGGNGIMPFLSADSASSNDVAGTEDVTNSLYILDEDLNIAGQINDIAKEEQVYSVRFMGDIGYFVTFKQVDPLFSVDLSDPAAPEIIGELKIPGFSEYLHPYGEGKLLGIGMSVDQEGVTTEGVKISMFDISDPAGVQEMDNYVIQGMYGTDVAYNYKSVFIDVEKNLFGFTGYGDATEYNLFTYDETGGFREVFSRELTGYGEARGVYAGETFYLIAGNTVESYTLSGFEKIDDIVL